MKLVLQFDCDADIINVPQFVIDGKELYRKRFVKWLSNKSTKHRYWIKIQDNNGNSYYGLRYRGDAFVHWLNSKILDQKGETATVLEEHVCDFPDTLPTLFF